MIEPDAAIKLTSGTALWVFIGMLVFALSALAALGMQITNFVRGGRPQKRDVTMQANAATKNDIERLETELERQVRSDAAAFATIRHDQTALRKRIDEVNDSLRADISNVPAQTITLLKNTGAIQRSQKS